MFLWFHVVGASTPGGYRNLLRIFQLSNKNVCLFTVDCYNMALSCGFQSFHVDSQEVVSRGRFHKSFLFWFTFHLPEIRPV